MLLSLTLAYAYPVRVYLAQRAQIDQLETAQVEQRKRIQDLADQLARWDDEDYVIAQARSRLQLVRKGELFYVVGVPPAVAGAGATDPNAAWFSQLWTSLQAADDPTGP